MYASAFCWCLNTSPLSYPRSPSHSTWHFKKLFEDSTSPTPKPLFLASVLFKNIERTLGNTEGNSSGDWRCVSFPSSVDPRRQQLICAPPPHGVIGNVPKWQRHQTLSLAFSNNLSLVEQKKEGYHPACSSLMWAG